MALRQKLGWSEGDLMRSDAKPCSRLMRQTAAIFTVGGALGFWVLCRLHYGIKVLSFLISDLRSHRLIKKTSTKLGFKQIRQSTGSSLYSY